MKKFKQTFTNKYSKVWAVQYHPEFDPVWMSGLMSQREKILLDEGIYNNLEELNSYKNYFSNIEMFNDQKVSLNIPDNLVNQKMHTLELSNWINLLKNQD